MVMKTNQNKIKQETNCTSSVGLSQMCSKPQQNLNLQSLFTHLIHLEHEKIHKKNITPVLIKQSPPRPHQGQ